MRESKNARIIIGFWFLALFISVTLLVSTAAADEGEASSLTKLTRIGEGGFGDPQNNYAWSVAEFNGDLYVGTGRNVPYFVSQGMKAKGIFPENWTLSFLTTPGGSPPPPLVLPNHTPPTPEDTITWSNDMSGEIWRYHEGFWMKVHQASTFVNPANGYTYPEGIGYRAMTVYTDSNGTEALYAGVGFGFGRTLLIMSTDGTTWVKVNTDSIPSRDTRAIIPHNGKLYMGTGDGIFATGSPSPTTDNWVKVADFQTASLRSFNGCLYAGTGNPIGPSETNGFEVWRSTTADPAGPGDWVCVVSGGAGDAWNVLAGTMRDYDGDLYVGSMNLPFATGTDGVKGFDIIRVDAGDSWDLIVGDKEPKIPTDPHDPPLSGWPSGFANPFNLYVWSFEEYEGKLYLGSFDIFSFARFIEDVPGGYETLIHAIQSREGAQTSLWQDETAAFFMGLLEIGAMSTEDTNGSYIIPLIRLLAHTFGGADLWVSSDGEHWAPVDLNGFGDADNYGFRTMLTTPEGIVVGTANPFAGCQVWVFSPGIAEPPAGVSDLRSTEHGNDSITWEWADPASENFSHVLVYIDGAFQKIVKKGTECFTATGLSPDTEYTIGTKTVGKNGQINQTMVTGTAWTTSAAHAWKFRSDLSNAGTYDDGGTRPSGVLLWSHITGDDVDSSPAVVNGVVYTGEYALDAKTGERLWRFRPFAASFSSPAVAGGRVYAGCDDGILFAVDAATGELVWNYTTADDVRSSPSVADGVVYIGSTDHNVYALDAESGDLIWNYTTGRPVYSSPAVAHGMIYIGSCDRNVYALDAESGDLIWNYTTGGMVYSSPAVVDGRVYIGSFDGHLYVLDALTGEFSWSYSAGSPVYSSPAVADGIVYFGCRNGFLYALNTGIPGYRWSYHAGEGIDSSPAVANGVVYFTSTDDGGGSGDLFALDAESGEFLWRYTTRMGLMSSPAVVDGVVYFGSRDRGAIHAIGPDLGPANLMIGKSAPTFHENAREMEYTIWYRNQGAGTAADVILTDCLPPSVEFVSGTGYPVYNDTTRTVTWGYIGALPHGAAGSQNLTVHIPSSVPYGTVLTNSANISTTTPESRYDDNTVSADTTIKALGVPPGVSVSPSLPGPWGEVCVDWRDSVTFSYNQTICPPETPVSIRIELDDGGPVITAPMIGGPQHWYYTTSFHPRHGRAVVTYETPGCVMAGISFNVNVDAAGYVYDTVSGERIAGADVWLQRPDEDGNWENVPADPSEPAMDPCENPLVTGARGQYQWNVTEGSYRVYVETEGYEPAGSTMVNSPPEISGLNIGLIPTTGKLWVISTPPGAGIFLDSVDTGHVTPHGVTAVPVGQHEVVLTLTGYPEYRETVTVNPGQWTHVNATFQLLPPVPDFSVSPESGAAPLDVEFTDHSTGAVTTRFWDFGDGASAWMNDTATVSHTYQVPGSYTVSLTAGNSDGNATATKGACISVSPSGIPPDARFSVVPIIGYTPMTVRFTDKSRGGPVSWHWNFGDGGTSSEKNPTHTYTTPGKYMPVLTVYNSGGCDSYTSSVWVRSRSPFPTYTPTPTVTPTQTTTPQPTIPPVPGYPPICFFAINKTLGSSPMTVQFTDRSFNAPTSWEWDFSDGHTSTVQNPVNTFSEPGTYVVSLTVKNDIGQSSTSRRVYVR